MTTLSQRELLQPSLLDRLTDDEPHKESESRDKRVLSFRQLRESVLRDLKSLLNAVCLETGEEELRGYPEARTSVVNFGIRNFAGTTVSSKSDSRLRRSIEEAILRFEPRIIPQTLRVHVVDKEDDLSDSHNNYDEHRYPNIVIFRIEGDLWAQPMPERLYLRTVLDLELGSIDVRAEGG